MFNNIKTSALSIVRCNMVAVIQDLICCWWFGVQIPYRWACMLRVISMKMEVQFLFPWASCQIRKVAACACAGNAGNVFPATAGQRSRHASLHVRDARTVLHAGIANQRFALKSMAGKTFPAFPAHAHPAILRIWQEAHAIVPSDVVYRMNTIGPSTGLLALQKTYIDVMNGNHW